MTKALGGSVVAIFVGTVLAGLWVANIAATGLTDLLEPLPVGNTLMIQNVLADEAWMGRRMEPVDFRALTPLIHSHVNPYGNFELDMGKRLTLDTQAA